MGVVSLAHYQMLGREKNCSGVFISVTSHQILVFGIKGLGGQICKIFESFYEGLVWL
jgi:hypothetical protein